MLSHAKDLGEHGRSSGYQVGRVSHGTNPGEIPFNKPPVSSWPSTSRPQNHSTLNFDAAWQRRPYRRVKGSLPKLARNGHGAMSALSPLSGVKRKSNLRVSF